MELQGKPVDGEISSAYRIETKETFLTVTFTDGTAANIGDILSTHIHGKRRIEEATVGPSPTEYRLSQDRID